MSLPLPYRPSIIFNGTNQYALGTQGVNGFDISAWSGLSNLTVNILVRPSIVIDALTPTKLLTEISDSSRTNYISTWLGAGTSGINNEFISLGKTSGATSVIGVTGSPLKLQSEYVMLSFIYTILNTSDPGVYINGIKIAAESIGTGFQGTSGVTLNKLSIGGSVSATSFLGASVREISYFSRIVTSSELINLYNFYGGSLNRISSTYKSLELYSLYSDANLIELYTGKVVGNYLIASKSTARNLTLINF